jgi:H+/gluconate symporter-like permease
MTTVGIIGMFLAIAVMIIGAYRGIKAVPLTVIAAFVIIVTNGLDIWPAYSKVYAGGFSNAILSYFLIFAASAAYAVVMNHTGCTAAIGYQLIKWFGTKHVIVVHLIIYLILTYGGISLFVVIFAVVNIAFVLYREADLPRHVMFAASAAGGGGITLTCLPGSPQLTNIIPSQFLGTPLTAAPVFSLIMAAIMVSLQLVYIKYAEKQCRKNNEHFSFPAGYDQSSLLIDKSQLPHPAKAFTPIVMLVLFIVVSSALKAPWAKDSAQLTILASLVALVLCIVLNPKKITPTKLKNWIGEGSEKGFMAILGLAAVIAFGSVVSSTAAFQSVVKWLIGLKMSVYIKGVVSTAVISGIAGSSSGGVRIMLQNLGEYFVSTAAQDGTNLQILHRLISIAAGTLDTLPHVSTLFLNFAIVGVTHKEAYKHYFWQTVAAPAVVTVIGLIAALILY